MGDGLDSRRDTERGEFGEELVDQIARQRLVVADAEIGDLRIALRDIRLVEHDDARSHAVVRIEDAEEAHQSGPWTILRVLEIDARVLAGPVDLAGMDGTLRHACLFLFCVVADLRTRPRPAT